MCSARPARLQRQDLELQLAAAEQALAGLLAWAAGGCPDVPQPAPRPLTGPRLSRAALSLVQRRLDALEPALLPLLGVDGFVALCAALIPEHFLDAGRPSAPTAGVPSTWAKCDELAGRAGRGEQLHRAGDATVPEGWALVPAPTGLNGTHNPRVIDGRPVEPALVPLRAPAG